MTKQKFTKKQSGFTLIEIMIVLAIIAILVGGVLFSQSETQRSGDAKLAADELTQTVGDLRGWYGGKPTCSGLTTAGAISLGVLPTQRVESGNFYAPWGDLIAVSCSTVNGVANGGYLFDYPNTNDETCKEFVKRIAPTATEIAIGADGSEVTVKSSSVAYDEVTAAVQCDAGTSMLIEFKK